METLLQHTCSFTLLSSSFLSGLSFFFFILPAYNSYELHEVLSFLDTSQIVCLYRPTLFTSRFDQHAPLMASSTPGFLCLTTLKQYPFQLICILDTANPFHTFSLVSFDAFFFVTCILGEKLSSVPLPISTRYHRHHSSLSFHIPPSLFAVPHA